MQFPSTTYSGNFHQIPVQTFSSEIILDARSSVRVVLSMSSTAYVEGRQELSKHTNSTESTALATIPEAARFLNLSRAMVHKLVADGRVPACRFGRAIRIPWSWLQSQVDPKSITGL